VAEKTDVSFPLNGVASAYGNDLQGKKWHLFVPPSVDGMPGASNKVDKVKVFLDSILKLGNFLGLPVCNHKTEFVQNNSSDEYRKYDLEQSLVCPTLLSTGEKGSENKEHIRIRIVGTNGNQGPTLLPC
jgi:hypothetical protein